MRKNQVSRTGNPVDSLTGIIVESILEKKGEEVVTLDLRRVNEAITDAFIICHADATVQVKAITDNIRKKVKENTGRSPWHSEGYENLEWVVLDYAEVVVHIFISEKRTFYNLEELWSDAAKWSKRGELNRIKNV